MKASEYIRDFQNRIDPDAVPVATWGGIAQVMINYETKTTYYLNYIREFWYSFGRYYPSIGGLGISVAKEQLRDAVKPQINPWMIIIMPDKDRVQYFGVKARDWIDYCNHHNTWNDHIAINHLQNGSIPARMLRNMETVKEQKGGLDNFL